MNSVIQAIRPINRLGFRALVLNYILRTFTKGKTGNIESAEHITKEFLRKASDNADKMMKFNHKVPGHILIESVLIPSPYGGVDAEWVSSLRSIDATSVNKVLLYFHGGAFFTLSAKSHRPITGRLAHFGARKVLAINYRKEPEHRFPAWLEDAIHAYRFLLNQGYLPNDIALGGDSAGGNLALITLQQIRAEQLPMPAAVFVISPWACMAGESESLIRNGEKDAMFSSKGVRSICDYHARGYDPKHPLLSPVNGDFTGFPPLLIQVGSTEVLRDDSRRVAKKARDDGVAVVLEEWHNLPHVFHLFSNFVPEGGRALRHINNFLEKVA